MVVFAYARLTPPRLLDGAAGGLFHDMAELPDLLQSEAAEATEATGP